MWNADAGSGAASPPRGQGMPRWRAGRAAGRGLDRSRDPPCWAGRAGRNHSRAARTCHRREGRNSWAHKLCAFGICVPAVRTAWPAAPRGDYAHGRLLRWASPSKALRALGAPLVQQALVRLPRCRGEPHPERSSMGSTARQVLPMDEVPLPSRVRARSHSAPPPRAAQTLHQGRRGRGFVCGAGEWCVRMTQLG